MAHQIYTHEKSRELFAKAAAVIPSGVYGHLGPAEGCFIPVEAFPLFGDRAKGSYFWDVDGNRYIDYMCAYGPNILGYGDPDVDEAAAKQREKGDCTTSPSPVMIDFADLLVDHVRTRLYPPQENNLLQGLLSRCLAVVPENRLFGHHRRGCNAQHLP